MNFFLGFFTMRRLIFTSCLFFCASGFQHSFDARRYAGDVFVKGGSTIKSPQKLNMVPVDPQQAWSAYNDALESNPLLVKSVTASVILGAADLAGQKLEGNKSEIDLARTVRFAFFGLILQAPWNHFYYLALDGALPPSEEPWTVVTLEKTIIDQFLQAPIFTVLIFAFLGALEGKNAESIKRQLDEDYKDTMVANWKLWVPATVVNLAFVPPMLRVLYLNCVFFFWSIFLSLKLNKDDSASKSSS